MRVHIISDMEGVSGIVKWEQTTGGEKMYDEGRRLYTEEINAAVRGAKAAGANEIVVMDCHGAGGAWSFNSLSRTCSTPPASSSFRTCGRSTRASSRRAATRLSSSACTRWRGRPTA